MSDGAREDLAFVADVLGLLLDGRPGRAALNARLAEAIQRIDAALAAEPEAGALDGSNHS